MLQQQALHNKYQQASVQTATPGQLLIMLVDGAIKFCRQGIEDIHQGNYEDANKHLARVQDIIQEFVITLDLNAPVAESLLLLYEYFVRKLIEANTKKDAAPAEEVLGYLQEMRITWAQAAKISVSASGAKYG